MHATTPISIDRSMIMQHTTALAITTACDDGGKKKVKTRQAGLRTPAAASMGRPSVEAVAMAGAVDYWPYCMPGECNGDGDGGTPAVPEHLRAFEAFLEEVVPADMVMASRREEDARVRRGGKRRSHDEDVKEKLKLWAKAVVKKTIENVKHRS